MADRFPLVVDSSNYRIEEIPAGDNLNFAGSKAKNLAVTGVSTFEGAINAQQGIQFPATQYNAADPNTLDDYEEGTFVAQIQVMDGFIGNPYGVYQYSGSGRVSSGTSTSSFDVGFAHTGTYVKIGGQVTVQIPTFRVPYQGYIGVPTTSNTTWAQGTRVGGGSSGRNGDVVGVGSTPAIIGIGSLPFTATRIASGAIGECRGATFIYNNRRLTGIQGPFVGISSGTNELTTLFSQLNYIRHQEAGSGSGPFTGYLFYDQTLQYSGSPTAQDPDAFSQSFLGAITITYNTY